MTDVAELRRLLEEAGGTACACSHPVLMASILAALPALLAVVEAAEAVNRENAKWGDVNLGTMCALAAALAALQEAP